MSPRRPRSRRERIAFRLPAAILEYPFEVFVAVYAILASFVVSVGGAVPEPLAQLLPHFVVVTWGLSLGIGGASVGAGLLSGRHIVTAMGLRLVTVALFTYLVGYVGFAWDIEALPSALLLGFIIALAGFRSFYLRTVTEMVERAHEEGE